MTWRSSIWLGLCFLIFLLPPHLSSAGLDYRKKADLNNLQFKMALHRGEDQLKAPLSFLSASERENRENRDEEIGESKEAKSKKGQEEKSQLENIIKPQYKNIKEKVGVYAFLAWLWLVIAVLMYILNQQIKEADRRRRLGL